MHRILVVDDEDSIREGLKEYAEFLGYHVTEARDGMEAVETCKNEDFDVIIMDVMMPRLDGFMACKEIKKHKNIPVLMLSARSEEYDKLFGFEIGIDDYVTKPFSAKEVLARVNVIVKRNSVIKESPETTNEIYRFDGLHIDITGRNVIVDGQKMELSPKELDLLFYLVRNKNIALSREKILNDVWQFDFYGDDRTIDTHIKLIRMNLGKYKSHIITIRGVGYKFES